MYSLSFTNRFEKDLKLIKKRSCHIKGVLLIIWLEVTIDNEIILVRVGSHADLF